MVDTIYSLSRIHLIYPIKLTEPRSYANVFIFCKLAFLFLWTFDSFVGLPAISILLCMPASSLSFHLKYQLNSETYFFGILTSHQFVSQEETRQYLEEMSTEQ